MFMVQLKEEKQKGYKIEIRKIESIFPNETFFEQFKSSKIFRK